jgi:2-keto-3-deoxy-6-phosphogluconate aldolase
MAELRKKREESVKARPAEPMLLGVGSVINPRELETAIEMGFDMIVGPDSGMGGCREPIEFVRMVRAAKCFGVPGSFSPGEFAYFLEREDGLSPDGIKIFNASVYGPSGVGALLAPYQRERHNGKMIMPTGGVNVKTGAGFQEQISKRGFCPVLGMSAPLELVTERKKLGDPDTIRESLAKFKAEFTPYKPA